VHDDARRALHPRTSRPRRDRLGLQRARLQVRAGDRAASGPDGPRYPLGVPFYQRLGDVPRKRHIQFRDNGTLLTEEVMGMEGFEGNESILYHLTSPCRVEKLGDFKPIERKEWVADEHSPHPLTTWEDDAGGDAVGGPQ